MKERRKREGDEGRLEEERNKTTNTIETISPLQLHLR